MNKNQILTSVAGGALVLGSLGGVVALNRVDPVAAVDDEPVTTVLATTSTTADGVVEQVDYQVEIVDDTPAAAAVAVADGASVADAAGAGENAALESDEELEEEHEHDDEDDDEGEEHDDD